MRRLTITTHSKREVVDITERTEKLLLGISGSSEGMCHLSALHTTVGLSIADLDPGTDLDMLDALSALIPKLTYRHPHDPAHAPDHILSTLMKPTISVPFSGGRLILGTWQRIVLFEFDGPRERDVVLTITEGK